MTETIVSTYVDILSQLKDSMSDQLEEGNACPESLSNTFLENNRTGLMATLHKVAKDQPEEVAQFLFDACVVNGTTTIVNAELLKMMHDLFPHLDELVEKADN